MVAHHHLLFTAKQTATLTTGNPIGTTTMETTIMLFGDTPTHIQTAFAFAEKAKTKQRKSGFSALFSGQNATTVHIAPLTGDRGQGSVVTVCSE